MLINMLQDCMKFSFGKKKSNSGNQIRKQLKKYWYDKKKKNQTKNKVEAKII